MMKYRIATSFSTQAFDELKLNQIEMLTSLLATLVMNNLIWPKGGQLCMSDYVIIGTIFVTGFGKIYQLRTKMIIQKNVIE